MGPLVLPPVLDRFAAGMIAADLQHRAGRGGPVVLDASGIERIGMAGLQLLLCALRAPLADGSVAARLDQPSAALCEAARLAGLTTHLGLDAEECR